MCLLRDARGLFLVILRMDGSQSRLRGERETSDLHTPYSRGAIAFVISHSSAHSLLGPPPKSVCDSAVIRRSFLRVRRPKAVIGEIAWRWLPVTVIPRHDFFHCGMMSSGGTCIYRLLPRQE